MPYYTSIGMSDTNIISSDIAEFSGEIPCSILIHGSKNEEKQSMMIIDDFFVEDKHRGDPLSSGMLSGELDKIHSLTIFGHTKLSVANMKQLIAIGMRFSTICTPYPKTTKSEESENSEFTE